MLMVLKIFTINQIANTLYIDTPIYDLSILTLDYKNCKKHSLQFHLSDLSPFKFNMKGRVFNQEPFTIYLRIVSIDCLQ